MSKSDVKVAVGFLFVLGLWYATGYIQGFSTGEAIAYQDGLKEGVSIGEAMKAATADEK